MLEPDFAGCDCPDFDGVVVLSLASHQGVAAIPIGAPSDVIVHPNGQTAYVASYDLFLVDTQREEVAGEIPGIGATRLALSTDGKLLLAQAVFSVTAIATEDNQVVWTTALASPAEDIAIGPDVGAAQPASDPPQNGCQLTMHSNRSSGWLLLFLPLMVVGWRSRVRGVVAATGRTGPKRVRIARTAAAPRTARAEGEAGAVGGLLRSVGRPG